MFGLIPKEEAFFELFRKAAHNMIEGSRMLKTMMEDAGFERVEWFNLAAGVVALHRGYVF